jgi:hypothetical protein
MFAPVDGEKGGAADTRRYKVVDQEYGTKGKSRRHFR